MYVIMWFYIEFVNGYGLVESFVVVVVNFCVGFFIEVIDIGMFCGVCCWFVDLIDYICLVFVGCVGELFLEGLSLV